MIESSILDFNKAMEQVSTEQHAVSLSISVAMTKTPPLVSTIVISSTTDLVITSTLPMDVTVETVNVPPPSMPLPLPVSFSTIPVVIAPIMPIITTTLVQVRSSTTLVSSSQLPTSLPIVTQVEVTTPTTQSVLPPWLDIVAPKRKKQVVSPDDFDFEQLTPSKAKVAKKPKIVSRVLIDLVSKRKYPEVIVPTIGKTKENIQVADYTIQTVDLGE